MSKAGFTTLSTAPSPSSTAISAIYSSPLRRAHETAEIFADTLSGGHGDAARPADASSSTTLNGGPVEVEVLDDLIERDFGIMTGQLTSSIVERCGEDHILATEKINYFLDSPGAETFPEMIDRARRLLSCVRKIAEEDSSSPLPSVLLVTHGDFGKMIYAAYYNLHWEDVLRQFHFGNSEVILLAKDSPPEKAHVFETLQFNS